MEDFEKLGIFYLGKEYNLEEDRVEQNPVLFKSKDLTTHGVIIGMTGSGKTGLGIGLLEEAVLDNIPVIAIDPKGDLGNLALAFPNLTGEDFSPWINLSEAENAGMTPEEYAEKQANLWRDMLAEWGQDEARIQKFRSAADITVYTPGSMSGNGVSLLESFQAPAQDMQKDSDAMRDRIQGTTAGILSLIGWEGDFFTDREYILVAAILEDAWSRGKSLELTDLITAIQKPPMEKIGVMDMESFYPSKERFQLAMGFNNLLASPGFKGWTSGDPLDVSQFLYRETGKPRVSIFSIAHLSDRERMFFVTMLLNEIVSWVRSQPGTGSLRAILYMDELFGYLPPTANPPSKQPLLTLLKQARAYGLGLVLSTQNPVDLDYKALSNAGTWFIGRLQTEQDKERVLSGLEGASAGGMFDKGRTEKILSSLGKRVFYLHSVHEEEPILFKTRSTLSYLAGPLSREQIAALPLMKPEKPVMAVADMAKKEPVLKSQVGEIEQETPVMSPELKQVFFPVLKESSEKVVYNPFLLGVADVLYNSGKYGVAVSKKVSLLTPIHEGPVSVDWKESKLTPIDIRNLDGLPVDGAGFTKVPAQAMNPSSYASWEKNFAQHIRSGAKLNLFYSPTYKVISEVDEPERDFRIRLQHLAHEHRDKEIELLKRKYASKIDTLENRMRRAEQMVESKSSQANQKKMEAAVSAGTALLGALFGRKAISATTISKVGTAVRSTGRALQSGEGIAQSKETLEAVKLQLDEMMAELEQQIGDLSTRYNSTDEQLDQVEIVANSGNITVQLVTLAWVPS